MQQSIPIANILWNLLFLFDIEMIRFDIVKMSFGVLGKFSNLIDCGHSFNDYRVKDETINSSV